MREIHLARTWPRLTRFIRWATSPLYGGIRIDAITLGYTVVYLKADPSAALIVHERQHVIQAQRMGRLRFWAAYLWEYVRHGYHNNRFEREARHVAGQED